ncbi:hypothetical protein [Pseudomonas oryzihabitans]|uniref:hypothetical protein n=1 Tax=Pseudomonas oryzihabitans TaxID=47885 RepID=UPI00214F1BE8|nr:hypothetical protein [Pseudomonas psychrotolerans]UUW73638.1 hypothetical protein NRG74_09720 [Pseudomonas psychrotolerans]
MSSTAATAPPTSRCQNGSTKTCPTPSSGSPFHSASAKGNRGRPRKTIDNPFFGHLGPTTLWERYPKFAEDVLEGIARLDWHDRPIGNGGSSKPLSVRHLADVLANLHIITTVSIMGALRIGKRHAQRYVKAIELAIPFLLASRPENLIQEMLNGTATIYPWIQWEDNELPPPSPDMLGKLQHDLRDLRITAGNE